MTSNWIKPARQGRGFEGRLFSKPADEAFVFDIRLVHAGDGREGKQDFTKALILALPAVFMFDVAWSRLAMLGALLLETAALLQASAYLKLFLGKRMIRYDLSPLDFLVEERHSVITRMRLLTRARNLAVGPAVTGLCLCILSFGLSAASLLSAVMGGLVLLVAVRTFHAYATVKPLKARLAAIDRRIESDLHLI